MKFTDQESGVNAVKFFPNGDAVVAGGNDGTVRKEGRKRRVGQLLPLLKLYRSDKWQDTIEITSR